MDTETLYKLKNHVRGVEYADYIKTGRHYDLANKINDTLVTVDRLVPIVELNKFADQNGLILIMEDAIASDATPLELKLACRQALKVFTAKYDTIDFAIPKVQVVFGGLVAGNIITKEAMDELLALGKQKVSLSISLFGEVINSQDIAKALNLP